MDSLSIAPLLGLLLLLLLLLLLAICRLGRIRHPGEPPLDKGLIPWLGHAVEFGRDAAKFLSNMRKKHGDIFTVQAAGKFITVLLDPHSYDSVLWESCSKLDFGQYARILMDRMFDVRLPDSDPNEEKAMLRMTLQNQNLPSLTKAVFFNLRTVLIFDPGTASQDWKDTGLFHLSYSTMLRAGYLTLYGNENKNYTDVSDQLKDQAHSLEVYNEFFKLDRYLMKAARSSLSAGWCKIISQNLVLSKLELVNWKVKTIPSNQTLKSIPNLEILGIIHLPVFSARSNWHFALNVSHGRSGTVNFMSAAPIPNFT